MSEFQLNNTLNRIETTLNFVDYIPFASTISGAFRSFGGELEFDAGLILAAVKFFQGFLNSDETTRKQYYDEAWQSVDYGLNGAANIVRGTVASFPFLGNIILFVYDLSGFRRTYGNVQSSSFYSVRNCFS